MKDEEENVHNMPRSHAINMLHQKRRDEIGEQYILPANCKNKAN